MEDKIFEKLNDLNIKDTKLLLEKDIDLSMDSSTRKRIEKSVMRKTGYYKKQFSNKNKINTVIRGIIMKRKMALALSAALVLTLAGGGYAYAKTPVAYVSIDINPSVELGVNAFDKVVSVKAYNEDGNDILKGADLLNTKVDEAVSTVVTNAINDGYIKEDGSSAIEITTSTDKEKVAAELDETLKQAVDETLTKNDVEAEVQTENVALARRDEARALGMTPGKLNLIQKLQALDPSITVEEYKNSSVKDIQKKTKELRKNGIHEATTQDGTSTTTTTQTTAADTAATNNTTTEATVSNEADTNEAAVVETKNNKTSNEKANNGNSKKEEAVVNQEQASQPIVEKQNKNPNSSAQSSNNSSKEDKSSNIKTDNNNENSNSSSKSENVSIKTDNNSASKSENSSKGNSSKSDNNGSNSSSSSNSGSGTSSSQGKGKNK